MNFKRNILTMIVALATVIVFGSCGSSDDNSSSPSGQFKVNVTDLTFTNNGGTNSLAVQADEQPTVTSSDPSWLTATFKNKGTLVYVFDITAAAYTGNSSSMTGYEDRTATLTVTQGANTATINVTQTPEYGLFVTSDKTISVDAAGGTVTVKLKANGSDFTVTPSANWVVDNTTRAALTEYSRSFTVYPNTGEARTATISFVLGNKTESVTVNQAKGDVAGMSHSASELSALMYPGWNLGNTLEGGSSDNNYTNKGGIDAETAWQNTKTTQAIIDYVKQQGFKSVRIPCSWIMGHISDANNSTIDATWMARVKEIVDYCINAGLYVVLNDHWDGGWIEVNGFSSSSSSYSLVDEATITAKIAVLKKIWTQIATEFKGYDEHVLFAGMNEPFQEYNLFNSHHEALTPILKRYNQAFIDAVRATGGNNATRTLVVQGPSTSITSTVKYFSMPTDVVTGRMMCEVHYYEPWDFCGSEDGSILYWSSANHGTSYNATWGEESWIKSQFESMKTNFVDKGYPVIIGEYGANWRDVSSISGADQDKHNASIKSYYYEVNRQAVNNGIVTFAWDINSTNKNGKKGTMTIINRSNLSVFNQFALDGIIQGTKADSWK